MTLSQNNAKKWMLLFVLCFSMIFAFFPQSKAEASGTRTFTTEDGLWDNTAYLTYWPGTNIVEKNVQVDVWNLTRISDNYNPFAVRPTQLSVRLCNASSKQCTEYKTFNTIKSGYGRVQFYNVLPGVYNVDIKDHIYWTKVSGKNLVIEWR
ncbi:hypothetical protein ACFQ88_06055 [Paenibacillus sp. NPDC056579]|uniref:hypothetical protein n=1 Tax=unclassified Paenibacillus TaxID=185978 RepID=UPI001EF7AFD9|nr:hypothetical protein [Paenibacillus sp. H1-7]ULL16539.1 hypothetical protein DVH26_20090 [Paenibacillus sp. H1-7]